jgi:putative transcriptional regulator
MATKKRPASSSKLSNARIKRSRVASDIITGLKEAAAFLHSDISLPVRLVSIAQSVDVAAIRSKLRMSQSEFASRYGFSVRTLQEWEQGRSQPDNAVRAYLTVIERNPAAVMEALSPAPRR